MGGVADADRDAVLARLLEAPLRQPGRQPSPAAGRVDDQIGVDDLAVSGAHPGDPVSVEDRLVDAAPLQGDVRQRGDAAADLPLQVRSARHVGGELVLQAVLSAQHVTGRPEMDAVRPVLQDRHPVGHHVGQQPGKQRLQLLGAARHQQVHVAVLRRGGAAGRFGGQFVTLEHRHLVSELRQHLGGTQPADAGPYHHCVSHWTHRITR